MYGILSDPLPKRTGIVDHRLMDGKVRSTSCPSIVGHQVLDGNISSTSIRPAIVSHPRLNGIVGNASKRPKYCCTTLVDGNLSDAHLNVLALLTIDL